MRLNLNTHAQAFFNIGTALQLKDKPDDAVKTYERALTIKPDYTDTSKWEML